MFSYNKELYKDNIREMVEAIPPSSFLKFKNWYEEMHEWLRLFAEERDLDIIPVIGTFAALSPQCSLKQNKQYLEMYYQGIEKHTKTQIGKADSINAWFGYLKPDQEKNINQVLKYLGGEKTSSFFLNILFPNKRTRVTIDRHILKIMGADNPKLTKKQYLFLEEVWKECADELNLLPQELQSILWSYYREANNLDKFYD